MDFGCFFGHKWNAWSDPVTKQVEVSLLENDGKTVLLQEQILVQYRRCEKCRVVQFDKQFNTNT